MKTRNPNQYLLQKFKEEHIEAIIPNGAVRFVKSHLGVLPEHWQNLHREQLIKKINEMCEYCSKVGLLKRKRIKGIKGYVYEFLI